MDSANECMDDTNSEILHEPTNDRMLIITPINTPIFTNGSAISLKTTTNKTNGPVLTYARWFRQTNDEYALPRSSSVCVGSKMLKCFDHRHPANYY